MELRDVLVAPIVILLVVTGGYLLRSRLTDGVNRRYFMPALGLKIFGALALGFLYQFYYDGGDTYNYHTHGSRHIWEAFVDSPATGFKLLTANGEIEHGVYKYTSRIPFYTDPSSYAVIRLAGLLDLFTFSSYAGTAVLFSAIGFLGGWFFFLAFYEKYPHLHRMLALATLFIPSVIIWGSGLLKDTITLAALGGMTYSIKRIFFDKRFKAGTFLLLIISFFLLFAIKKYVLICFVPALMIWLAARTLSTVRSVALRVMILPFLAGIIIVTGYFAVIRIGSDDPRYALDNIAQTAKITAYDIGFYTGRDAGSGYSLGQLDGTFQSMLYLAPQAVNVTLFRPYLWEVRNPLMLLSSAESTLILAATIWLLVTCWSSLGRSLVKPDVLFCLVFSITFAFAVGVSTFNFGTLSRYKIPLLPFYAIALIIIYDHAKSERKLATFDSTE